MTEEKQKYFHIYRDVRFLGDSTHLREVEPVKDGNYETAYNTVKNALTLERWNSYVITLCGDNRR